MPYSVAVDIGGTFTDLVAYDRRQPLGHLHQIARQLTTILLQACSIALPRPSSTRALRLSSITARRWSSTRSSSATARKAALVTTQGFRDVLEIARGNRPDPFDLHYRRDEPLIPRVLRFEVIERIGSKGEIIIPLDCRRAAGARRRAQGTRRRGGRDLLHEFVRQPGARGGGRRASSQLCCPASMSPQAPN